MKYLVLGAAGMQGKAVIYDLCRSPEAREIVCADVRPEQLLPFGKFLDFGKIRLTKLDASNKADLVELMRDQVDVVIDLLPISFIGVVSEAAVEAGVSVVNTFYASALPEGIHEKAAAQNMIIMPEAGLDPGIDLILCGYGVGKLDHVYELHSYCGGLPEPSAIDNPLKYKLTWIWDGVLLSHKRPGKIMKNGVVIDIPAADQHAPQWVETLNFPGIDAELEMIVNGDAMVFADILGISATLRHTSRRYIRWNGHAQLWHALKQLQFLSDEPVAGLSPSLTPHAFMRAHLEPQLHYKEEEKDIVLMRNTIAGVKDNEDIQITFDLVDYRDTRTGLFAMNRTVGFTASIIAQMIARGDIRGSGLMRTTKDVPYLSFIEELHKRDIVIQERIQPIVSL
ncbi:saccharopine dehydrogenase family protein [Paenibacillus methanolicus]|uniref:Saccharopine dehydrogenase-like NADP-dependent oxidoreductase n=1 Tax=Paenibacillus methanolicus TaxID=582686 RepID=A0A5S5CKA4_9BACL|nr:saccharopine dehydrogenase C-terminal domain-containing protein [Paenibacillus methanolicus]TYP79337.1 saccharopine dehydrogenase-like NADP-dependent oxidoreductase [Paenibacillus methanolicus]